MTKKTLIIGSLIGLGVYAFYAYSKKQKLAKEELREEEENFSPTAEAQAQFNETVANSMQATAQSMQGMGGAGASIQAMKEQYEKEQAEISVDEEDFVENATI